MMMPSIFGGNLFNDDWMDFSFPDIDKELYGKHAKNLMKTDVKEKDGNYEVAIDLPGFKKDEITAELKDGYLTISAAKGLDKDEKDKEKSIQSSLNKFPPKILGIIIISHLSFFFIIMFWRVRFGFLTLAFYVKRIEKFSIRLVVSCWAFGSLASLLSPSLLL